jgi:hypothetical protein
MARGPLGGKSCEVRAQTAHRERHGVWRNTYLRRATISELTSGVLDCAMQRHTTCFVSLSPLAVPLPMRGLAKPLLAMCVKRYCPE